MDMMCVPKVTDAPTPINSITTTTHRHRHQVGTSKDEFRSLGQADQVHALREAALRECRGSLQTLVTASEGWVRDECLKHWHALVNDVEDEAEVEDEVGVEEEEAGMHPWVLRLKWLKWENLSTQPKQ